MFLKNNFFSFHSEVKGSKAFTLIELMVTVAIAMILMSIVLFNYSTFNDKLALSSAGQNVALDIRKAQAYSLSAKEYSSGTGYFNYAYGVYFNSFFPFQNTNYYGFIDKDDTHTVSLFTMDCSPQTSGECDDIYSFGNGIKIYCIGTTDECPLSDTTKANITFKRPNLDALIYLSTNSGVTSGPKEHVLIRLISPKGRTIDIIVYNTGQVEVK